MLGINFDLNNLKENWKHILVGVGVNCSFWYLTIFLFNRSLIIDLPFYVPMLITIPLAIISFHISSLIGTCIYFVTNYNKIFDDEKMKLIDTEYKSKYLTDEEIDNIPAKNGMSYSVMFLSIVVFYKYYLQPDTTLTQITFFYFTLLIFLGAVALVILIIALLMFKSKFKKLKEVRDSLLNQNKDNEMNPK